MNSKNKLLSSIHKMFRKDPYIVSLLNAAGIELDKVADKTIQIKKEFLFSTMSMEQVARLENLLNFKTTNTTLEGKRLEIEARWKSSGKCDLILLQSIADTWNTGKIIVRFVNGTIQFGFIGEIQDTYDLKSLQNAIAEAKPAHLGFDFIYSEKINSSLFFNSFISEELEEDFIEKSKIIDINLSYYKGIYQEVSENYGL